MRLLLSGGATGWAHFARECANAAAPSGKRTASSRERQSDIAQLLNWQSAAFGTPSNHVQRVRVTEHSVGVKERPQNRSR